MKAQQWKTIELCFTDHQAPKSVKCGIQAVFTAPDGQTIQRDAFWNGGNQYMIRFAPTQVGQWTYTVTGTADVHADKKIDCLPYDGDLPIYQHGFLKIGPKGRYLCHADNHPFFWLGDTHWQFAVAERFDESNDLRFSSQFCAIVDRRFKQKFNVYQCNFHCEPKPMYPGSPHYFMEENGRWIPNIEFFQNNLDKKMAYLADKGFSIAAGFSWFMAILAEGAVDYFKMGCAVP